MGSSAGTWFRHWGLSKDPFGELGAPYVPSPPHEEAVARLVHTIERSERHALFSAAAGLGKTTVLRRALSEARDPRRRIASVSCPPDGTFLFTELASRLGVRVGKNPRRLESWRTLERAVRMASLQSYHVVLAVDDCNEKTCPDVHGHLGLLHHLAAGHGTHLTVIQVGREESGAQIGSPDAWSLAVVLHPFTRSQAEGFLRAKLEAAGCVEAIFTPRAITRMHLFSSGVPRGLERLATLCLAAGAGRGLEAITPDVVDGVARECRDGDGGNPVPRPLEPTKGLA